MRDIKAMISRVVAMKHHPGMQGVRKQMRMACTWIEAKLQEPALVGGLVYPPHGVNPPS